METVTSGTGGRFIRGDNDIDGAIATLEATPEFVYVLGFSPTDVKLDGKYHKLEIALKRPRGLSVEGRRGYYATEAEPDGSLETRTRVRDAFLSGAELRDLPVRIQVRTSRKPDAPIVLTATVHIDVSKLPFGADGTVNRAVLTLRVGVFDDNGVLVKDTWQEVAMQTRKEDVPRVRAGGLEVESSFEVTPGRYMIRILAADASGRLMGAGRTAVTVRDY
jgi:hypothetical protein